MARRTFTMVDVTEILQHWYAGRPKVEGRAQSEGGCEDRPPVRGPGGGGRDGAGRAWRARLCRLGRPAGNRRGLVTGWFCVSRSA
jgi:hypothetical protein